LQIVADALCSVACFPTSAFSVVTFRNITFPSPSTWQNAEVQYQYLQYWQQISRTMVPLVRALLHVTWQLALQLLSILALNLRPLAFARVGPQHVEKFIGPV